MHFVQGEMQLFLSKSGAIPIKKILLFFQGNFLSKMASLLILIPKSSQMASVSDKTQANIPSMYFASVNFSLNSYLQSWLKTAEIFKTC